MAVKFGMSHRKNHDPVPHISTAFAPTIFYRFKKRKNKIKKKERVGKVERNFLTAFDTANSARYLFSKLVRIPLTPRYFVKYHTLSGGTFLSPCHTRYLARKRAREREKLITASRDEYFTGASAD